MTLLNHLSTWSFKNSQPLPKKDAKDCQSIIKNIIPKRALSNLLWPIFSKKLVGWRPSLVNCRPLLLVTRSFSSTFQTSHSPMTQEEKTSGASLEHPLSSLLARTSWDPPSRRQWSGCARAVRWWPSQRGRSDGPRRDGPHAPWARFHFGFTASDRGVARNWDLWR